MDLVRLVDLRVVHASQGIAAVELQSEGAVRVCVHQSNGAADESREAGCLHGHVVFFAGAADVKNEARSDRDRNVGVEGEVNGVRRERDLDELQTDEDGTVEIVG